jgi:uncharacterized membrane protein YjfL (UPF0719 family)
MRPSRPLAALALACLAAAPAAAQSAASSLSVDALLSTLVYGAIGILITVAGFFVFDKVAGLNLRHELVEDQNVAVGIMLAGLFIGCSIVMAAVMMS